MVDLCPKDLHERLKSDWPEAKDQLHSGGWERTMLLEKWIDDHLTTKKGPFKILDLCCGEGSTACYFAKKKNWSVVGLDLAQHAIDSANERVISDKLTDTVSFVAGSAMEMPFENESFDVAYGQDPDALASPEMKKVHSELFRVLKPGGVFIFHHHWVPGRGWPEDKFKAYLKESGSDEVNCDMYVDGLEKVGFEVKAEDISELARSHLGGQLANMKKRVSKEGDELQHWLVVTEKWARNMNFGIDAHCHKPAPGKNHDASGS